MRIHKNATPRPLSGLLLGGLLSLLNLAGAFVTLMALGGLGNWAGWQFVGVFALAELATGTGFIIGPNIWRLPVAQARSRVPVRLAASTVLIPHWAAGAKALMGGVLLVAAAARVGVGPASGGVLLVAFGMLALVVGLSLLAARAGVAHPDRDVFEVVIRRHGHPARELPAISISAIVVQLLLNVGVFPLVKLTEPSILFAPEIAPSAPFLGWSVVAGSATLAAGLIAWTGRLALRAPREQQREAEQHA